MRITSSATAGAVLAALVLASPAIAQTSSSDAYGGSVVTQPSPPPTSAPVTPTVAESPPASSTAPAPSSAAPTAPSPGSNPPASGVRGESDSGAPRSQTLPTADRPAAERTPVSADVLPATASAPAPAAAQPAAAVTRTQGADEAGVLPFTGLELGFVAALGLALLGTALLLRRATN